jgi:hypothetical protein
MMHRSIFAILFACAAVLSTACEKPKDEDCKRAVANIRNLYGTTNFAQGLPVQSAVRSCRGSASKESVRCVIAAKSLDDLGACGGGEFLEAIRGEASQTPAAPAQQPQAPTAPAQQPQAPAQEQPPAAPAQGQPPAAPAQQPPAAAPAQQPPAAAPAQQQPAAAPAQQQPPAGQGAE